MKAVKIIILIGAIINIAIWIDINMFLTSIFIIIAITTLILLLKEYDNIYIEDAEKKINEGTKKENNYTKEKQDQIKYNNSNTLIGIIIILLIIIIALIIYLNSDNYKLIELQIKFNEFINKLKI